MAEGIPISCGDCSAHFQLDPSGDIQGAACSECGGKRFFRDQPSPTHSDGDLRNMPGEHDPVAGEDPGGFPLGEGNIVGSPGQRGEGVRPGRGAFEPVHGRSTPRVGMPREKYNLDPGWQPELELTRQNPQDIYDQHRGVLEGFERWVPPANQPDADPPGNWHMKFRENAEPNPNGTWTPTDEMGTSYIDPTTLQGYKLLKGRLPQLPSELPGQRQPQLNEGEPAIEGRERVGAGLADYNQIGQLRQGLPQEMQMQIDRMLREQGPQAVLRFLQQQRPGYEAPSPFAMEPVVPPWQGLVNRLFSGTQRVEPMNTLNMEPYEPLWHESYLPKTAGPALGPLMEGIGSLAAKAMPTLMRGTLMGTGMQMGKDLMGGGQQQQQGGQQGGGMAPQGPDPAPSMGMLGKADIPSLLVAAMETPHSVKSLDEQHDDPENQDQKEFNVGDHDPSNLKNPNNEDSGASGEDGVRASGGFAPDSPAIERATMILPLLLHYFDSEESGEADPLIRALHEALEKENPGYLDQEDPQGDMLVEQLKSHHKSPHGVHAGVNAFPSGLPAQPGTGMDSPNPQGANGTCPTCGAPLAADGSCPQCGAKQQPQGGQLGQQGGGFVPGASMPPNAFTGKVANDQGPVTPEQQQAMIQAMRMKGMSHLIPDMLQNPANWGWLLNEIQNQPNSPPLVDPSQAQPSAAPMGQMGMPGGGGAPGAMPVMDPSQPGGGGGMPMQPMAKKAGPLGPGIPDSPQGWHEYDPYRLPEGVLHKHNCPRCGAPSMGPSGKCSHCGYVIGDEDEGLGLQEADPTGPHTMQHNDLGLQYETPRWGRTAADTVHIRCPNCGSGSTTVRPGSSEETTSFECHSCGKLIDDVGSKIDQDRYKGSSTRLNSQLHVGLVDVPNPALNGQDSSLVWQDRDGQPVEMNQTYKLYTAGVQEPDIVKVVERKPDELGLKLVGELSNIARDQNTPDFHIKPDQLRTGKYTLEHTGVVQDSPEQPLGGMPGLEQIPQSGPTTDEATNSYPNQGTLSSVKPEDYDDLCHKCGCDWITHTASSETTTMHECARCGSAWETKDEWEGRQANADLNWLYDGGNNDDFWSGMERAQEIRSTGGQSRSITAALAKDDRYQRIHDILESNKQAYGGFGKIAGRHFSPSEQRELINERGSARNSDLMDLTGTHYTTLMGYDPRDPKGRANEMNAPDSHLVLGL